MGNRLGQFEELTLLAITALGESAYGVTIRRKLAEATERDVSIGAVYTTLERLERKGYVSSRIGEATPERGGRAKRFFKIDAPGKRALSEAREAATRMISGLSHAS